jgi:phosphoribosylanthranilate isomerase
LHGDESPAFCKKIRRRVIKAIRVKDIQSLKKLSDYPVSSFLLDTFSEDQYGGTGKVFDWNSLIQLKNMVRSFLQVA